MWTYACRRVAQPAKPVCNVGKTLLQIVAFWSFFLWVLPTFVYYGETRFGLAHFRFTHPLWQAVGITLFVVMGTLGFSCGMIMAAKGGGTPLPLDCPNRLVLIGPYRYVRNPMAIAGLAQGVAVGLYLGSPAVVLYALAGVGLWNYGVRPWEEKDLEQRFGPAYDHYRKSVRCWILHRYPYTPPGQLPDPSGHIVYPQS